MQIHINFDFGGRFCFQNTPSCDVAVVDVGRCVFSFLRRIILGFSAGSALSTVRGWNRAPFFRVVLFVDIWLEGKRGHSEAEVHSVRRFLIANCRCRSFRFRCSAVALLSEKSNVLYVGSYWALYFGLLFSLVNISAANVSHRLRDWRWIYMDDLFAYTIHLLNRLPWSWLYTGMDGTYRAIKSNTEK